MRRILTMRQRKCINCNRHIKNNATICRHCNWDQKQPVPTGVTQPAGVGDGGDQTRQFHEEHPLDVVATAGQTNGQPGESDQAIFQQALPTFTGVPLTPQASPAPKTGRSLKILGVITGVLFLALFVGLIWQANQASQQEARANESATKAALAEFHATSVANNATVVAQNLDATATAVAGQIKKERNQQATAAAATAQAQAHLIATARAQAATAQANANQAQAALIQFQTYQTATAMANASATAEARLAADATATAITQATADAAATVAAAPTAAPVIQPTSKPAPKAFKNWYNQLSWTPSIGQSANGHTRVKAVVSLPNGYTYDLRSMGLRLVGDPNGDKKPGSGAFWDLGAGTHVVQLIQFKAVGAAVVSEITVEVVDRQTTVVTFTGKVK